MQVAAPPILREARRRHAAPFCRPYIASRHYLCLTTPRLRNLAAPGTARWPTSRSTWGLIAGLCAALFTGEYPEGIQGFLVSAYRYTLRVEAYVGFLTNRYPRLQPRRVRQRLARRRWRWTLTTVCQDKLAADDGHVRNR